MKTDVLELLFAISLKARILREWQKANRAQEQAFSERELLVLELVDDFAPVTEKGLMKILGLASSSVSELVKKLLELGLIDEGQMGRGKPLKLTGPGREKLRELKQVSATRYSYLFEGLKDSEWTALTRIFKTVDRNAGRFIDRMVFDRCSER